MAVELIVTIKDEEKNTYKHNFLIYEEFSLKYEDPLIDKCIREAREICKATPDEIVIKATLRM